MPDLVAPTAEPPGLFSEFQVTGCAAFFGPVAGGWLLRRNYFAIGESDLGQRVIILSLLFTAGLFVATSYLPTDTPSSAYSLPSAAIYWLIYRRFFRSKFDKAMAQGGRKLSFWQVVGLGLIAFPVTLFIGFLTIAVAPIKAINHVSYATNDVYYEQAATEADADALMRQLKYYEAFVEDSGWEVTLVIPKGAQHRVIVKWLVMSAPEEGSEIYEAFETIRKYLAETLYADKEEVWFSFVNPLGLQQLRLPRDDAST